MIEHDNIPDQPLIALYTSWPGFVRPILWYRHYIGASRQDSERVALSISSRCICNKQFKLLTSPPPFHSTTVTQPCWLHQWQDIALAETGIYLNDHERLTAPSYHILTNTSVDKLRRQMSSPFIGTFLLRHLPLQTYWRTVFSRIRRSVGSSSIAVKILTWPSSYHILTDW